jgi:hypothetical protein
VVIYLTLFIADILLGGIWLWAVTTWTGPRFPIADLVITVCLCSGLALLPGYGWLLALVVLWLILRRVERADLWPEIVVMAGGCAFIWPALYVTGTSLTS